MYMYPVGLCACRLFEKLFKSPQKIDAADCLHMHLLFAHHIYYLHTASSMRHQLHLRLD